MEDFDDLASVARGLVESANSIQLGANTFLSIASDTANRVLAHMNETPLSQTGACLEKFIGWMEAKFEVNNIVGLRNLAFAYATQDESLLDEFRSFGENVVIVVPECVEELNELKLSSEISKKKQKKTSSKTLTINRFPKRTQKTRENPPIEIVHDHSMPLKTTNASKRSTTQSNSKPTQKKSTTITTESDARPKKKAKVSASNSKSLSAKKKSTTTRKVTKIAQFPSTLPQSVEERNPRQQIVHEVDHDIQPLQIGETSQVVGSRRPSSRQAAVTGNFIRRVRATKFLHPNLIASDKELRDIAEAIRKSKNDIDPESLQYNETSLDDNELDIVSETIEKVVLEKPWEAWSTNFHSFLPNDTKEREEFNLALRSFFEEHGRSLWERFFWTNKGKEFQTSYNTALGVYAQLAYRLSELEGDDVFKYLMNTLHPAWPTIMNRAYSLYQMKSSDALKYIKSESHHRWPKLPKSKKIDPLLIVSLTAQKGIDFAMGHQIPPSWAKDLLERLKKDSTYDVMKCPYIDVPTFGEPFPTHFGEFPTRASGFRWDWKRKEIVHLIATM